MAHYALLNEENVVVDVIVGKDEDDLVEGIESWEDHYTEVTGLLCKRTSYNTIGNEHVLGGTPFRKNYAGIGFAYDEERDAFIPPKPYESWELDEESCWWESPVPYPSDNGPYIWNENTLSWIKPE